MFSNKQHDYFIEPLPHYLYKEDFIQNDYHRPHIIFRRSPSSNSNNGVKEMLHKYWYRKPASTCATVSKSNHYKI